MHFEGDTHSQTTEMHEAGCPAGGSMVGQKGKFLSSISVFFHWGQLSVLSIIPVRKNRTEWAELSALPEWPGKSFRNKSIISWLIMRKKTTESLGSLWRGAGLGKWCHYVNWVGNDGNVEVKHQKERNRSERPEEAKEVLRRKCQWGQRKRRGERCGNSPMPDQLRVRYIFPELPTY